MVRGRPLSLVDPAPATHTGRLRRFAFQDAINAVAQVALVRLQLDLLRQMRGLVHCAAAFDPAHGEWIEYSVWHVSDAPPGDAVSPARAADMMRRLDSLGRN